MSEPRRLSESARRALGHIRARTVQGRFASRLYYMTEERWNGALDELRRAGHEISWTLGTVADDPSVRGGWVLDEQLTRRGASEQQQAARPTAENSEADEAALLGMIAQPPTHAMAAFTPSVAPNRARGVRSSGSQRRASRRGR
jgi:hypothetical protein